MKKDKAKSCLSETKLALKAKKAAYYVAYEAAETAREAYHGFRHLLLIDLKAKKAAYDVAYEAYNAAYDVAYEAYNAAYEAYCAADAGSAAAAGEIEQIQEGMDEAVTAEVMDGAGKLDKL